MQKSRPDEDKMKVCFLYKALSFSGDYNPKKLQKAVLLPVVADLECMKYGKTA